MKKNRLTLMTLDQFDIDYASSEELWDGIADLPKEIRKLINMSMPLGAANANPMAGGYSGSKVVQDGDTSFNTAAKVYAFYNGLAAAATVRRNN